MKFLLFLLLILLLAMAIALLGAAAYRQLRGGSRRGASNKRGSIDPSRVAEAEYSILDEEEVNHKDRG